LVIPEPFLSWLHALFILLGQNDEKALFLLLLLEETGVPLPAPGDVVILFAGYRASMGEMGVLEASVAVTLAVMMGSTILYTVSRKFGHIILFKYGKIIHLDESKLAKVEGWIHEHGPIMVLIGRLTPGLRTPTSIMAGVFEVPFPQFLLFTTLSALIWSGFWLGSGFFFGKKLVPLVRHFDKSGYIVLAAVILLITWLLVRRQQRRARQRVGSKVEQSGGG
jgi:membrane protein DedA with SNARE-associated domain